MKKVFPLFIFAAICITIVLWVFLAPEQQNAIEKVNPESAVARKKEKTVICIDKCYEITAENLLRLYQEVFPKSVPAIRFTKIPTDESEREIFITKTRLEIMAGGGPDAFLLNCADCLFNDREVLFSSPESAMYSRLFYPLDDLIAEAEHFQTEQLNPQILALGQTDEGQMLLPLIYTYPVAWASESELKKVDSLAWEDVISGKSKALKIAANAAAGYPIGFSFLFPELTDWERDNLLISREELEERIEEKLSVEPLMLLADEKRNSAKLLSCDLFAQKKKNRVYFPLCGEDGTITAAVTLFAAINANASPEKAKEAFALFDFMLSDELVSGDGFYLRTYYHPETGEASKIYTGQDFYTLAIYGGGHAERDYPLVSGISVKDQGEFFEGCFDPKPEGSMEVIREFRDRIGHVRFYSGVDAALNKAVTDLSKFGKRGEPDELADEVYNTMLMILAES